MAMISMAVGLNENTPHWWWYAVRRRMEQGEINKKEVMMALRALIEEARKLPNAPMMKEPETLDEHWNTVVCYFVSRWLNPGKVIRQMENLYNTRKYSPNPAGAKSGQPEALTHARKGAMHGVPF